MNDFLTVNQTLTGDSLEIPVNVKCEHLNSERPTYNLIPEKS